MSRKTQRNKPKAAAPAAAPAPAAPKSDAGKIALLVGLAVLVLVGCVVAAVMLTSPSSPSSASSAFAAPDRPAPQAANAAALTREHPPTKGAPEAKVHIVEFLDPACEACAVFSGHVKRLLEEHPGRIRVSIRHVPFHRNAADVVKMIEAARFQGAYEKVLEGLFATQSQWTANHAVQVDRAWAVVEQLGIDVPRLKADMQNPEVARRMQLDLEDAKALMVAKTPEFFVNGRALPEFGEAPLRAVVAEELKRAYP